MTARNNKPRRAGGVYIAVLGTSLIVALLGLSALLGQRIQNRMLVAASDIRQAQLNANAAVELALLTMKQDANWRTTYANGDWFTQRGTNAGTCSLNVTDPVDSNLANSPDDPVLVLGVGYSGKAEQRVEVTVDPRKDPFSCLRSAIATGGAINLSADTLRTNGLISANDIDATASQVYGTVEAVTVTGSTYNGATTQINSTKRPTMPDWTAVFNYYRTNGTPLNVNNLPTSTPNLGRNVNMANGTTDWTGSPPWTTLGSADINQTGSFQRSGSFSLMVQNRDYWYSGAAQRIDDFVKPGGQYTVEAWVYVNGGVAKNFSVTLVTKGTASTVQSVTGPSTLVVVGVLNIGWTKVAATLTAPSWSGNLEYAFVQFAGADALNAGTFYLDDLDIREVLSGRLIYRQVLSPSVNTIYAGAPTNAQGIYWIDCNGQRLIIERSRILGTLLVVNPGANSCINNGPINWSPAVNGYPALMVDASNASDANFSLRATNRILSEAENQVNFNPGGAPYDFNNSSASSTDSSANDIYPCEIRGLVVVRNDLTYQNNPLVRGQVIVGGNVNNSSGELDVEFLQDSLLNPPPGFLAPYSYSRRPASVRKAVLP
ncbi:MAG: carbohydrate binding domain-containing protein [Planctomycetes bacterium]|nr:carbohydrate binding domain-containing protein [Planctomycetota bacterium]